MNDTRRLARHITMTLFLAQSLGSAGFIAAATVNAIVGAQLSGRAAWAGVPTALYLLGSAVAAVGWSYVSDRFGRRLHLVLGLLTGVLGATLAAAAVLVHSFAVLLAGLALMGAAQAALQLARFAAAEVNTIAERGRAISTVVMGGAVGSIFGPLLVGPTGRVAVRAGIDALAAPYGISLVLFALAAVVIGLWLRPDPRELGQAIAGYEATVDHPPALARPLGSILAVPGTVIAVTAMVCGQLTMVMLMGITSLHMQGHHHALPSISAVISSHTFGMFAFSILSGRLSDRWGRLPVIVTGSIALVVACAIAPLSSAVAPLAIALFLLGLGWNFCFVGGSSLLADQLSPPERAHMQGVNDLLIGLVSATGSIGSGIVFTTVGYGRIALVGALAALIPLAFSVYWRASGRAAVPAQ